MFKQLLIFCSLIFAVSAQADDGEKVVRDALHTLIPNATPELVQKSELPGFYEAVIGGQVLYVSADGKYLVQGEVFDVARKSGLSSRSLATVRNNALQSLPASKRIVFSPPTVKHTVTVFTDVDCPYCRQFHKQIAAYNQLGIAVQYVLFPLAIHKDANKKAIAVWCSQDRNAAYTAAMNGQDPGQKTCDNPVDETTKLAIKIGISGTPTILSSDGTQVNGSLAQDPKQLLAELDRLDAAVAKTPVAAK